MIYSHSKHINQTSLLIMISFHKLLVGNSHYARNLIIIDKPQENFKKLMINVYLAKCTNLPPIPKG